MRCTSPTWALVALIARTIVLRRLGRHGEHRQPHGKPREPGRIQVTAATKAVLGDTFSFSPRGPIEIKGIGVIETFWLVGRA